MRVVVAGLGSPGPQAPQSSPARTTSLRWIRSIQKRIFARCRRFRWTVTTPCWLAFRIEPKLELLSYCVDHGKHVLVEKPLWAES